MRLEKARESSQAAQSCLGAVVASEAAGFHRDAWGHAGLQATFTTELIHRRKLYPRQLAEYLSRGLFWRNIADYGDAQIGQRRAKQLVVWARAFVGKVQEIASHEIR